MTGLFCVLSWSSQVKVFWSFPKKEGEIWWNVFSTKLLSFLSHKVCHLPSSPILLHKFTIINIED